MITIEGHLEKITFYNEENHYTIARLTTAESKSRVTVVGYMAGISPGQALKISGAWETHPKFGQQFKVNTFEITLPATIDGIRKYLESDIIKGIGSLMAGRLVDHFGSDTLDIIESDPERLTEVPGIGNAKVALITGAWKDHHIIRELMQYLQSLDVKASYSARILKEYGESAIDILRTDPFRLAEDIPGIGFIIADTITRNRGMSEDDPNRVRACISHIIQSAADEGHTYIPEDQALERCENVFGIGGDDALKVLEDLSHSGDVIIDEIDGARALFSPDLYKAETSIANRLCAFLSIPSAYKEIAPEQLSKEVLKKLAIKLSSEQLHILESILTHRVAVITGGPGTGKTTLIRSINAILEASGKRIILAAPTGRASRRLSDIVQRDARTIHRLLGYSFKKESFEKDQDNPIDTDAVIIDEASMVDTFLMSHLIKAIPVTAMLILVGDVFQLPSVGPGNVLEDIITSEIVPVFYLTKVFRQATESPIIMNAHMIRQGEYPDLDQTTQGEELSEFYFIERNDPDSIVDTIVKLCSQSIPGKFGFDATKEIQVLTPMHKGVVGTINLNKLLQKALNKSPSQLNIMGNAYKTGDKVMHLKNNYLKDVFNGDIGTIRAIDEDTKQVAVDYDGREVIYDSDEMHELSLAYAISVHKSQGSEYPAVVVPITTHHYIMLQRNLLYTAITRGKKLVILIGTKKAFAIALNNDKPRKRFSNLYQKLQNR